RQPPDLGRSSCKRLLQQSIMDHINPYTSPSEGTKRHHTTRKPMLQIGCLVALVLFSTYVALVTYPFGAWKFGAALGTLAFVSIFLRVGWLVPFAVAGTYAGLLLDARVKGGTIESQMHETVMSIVTGTAYGFAIGAMIDRIKRSHTHVRRADEQSHALEPAAGPDSNGKSSPPAQ
ncbi:MAG: hypothetical protein KDB63_22950, partial [Nocardioidaceae bacterium]|nr:hypothetical protein [Nocardioidaceae bacterium]